MPVVIDVEMKIESDHLLFFILVAAGPGLGSAKFGEHSPGASGFWLRNENRFPRPEV